MPVRKVPYWKLAETILVCESDIEVVLKSKYKSTAFCLFSQGLVLKYSHALLTD